MGERIGQKIIAGSKEERRVGVLDVRKILRHRWERPVFFLTILPFILWVLFSGSSSIFTGFLIFGVVWIGLSIALRMSRAKMLAHGVRVSPTQLPSVMECVELCAQKAPLNYPVETFVVPSRELNAFTFGEFGSRTIVLTSGLVEALGQDELCSVVAHEWGHLLFGHTLVGSLFSALTQGAVIAMQMSTIASQASAPESERQDSKQEGGGIIIVILSAIALLLAPIVFSAYRRLSEISADRLSVLISGNADKPIAALAKLAVGPELAAELNEEELIAQAEQAGKNISGMIQQLLGSHPFVGSRFKAMRRWSQSPEYCEVLTLISRE